MPSALDHWLWTPDLTSGPPSLVFYWPGLAIKVKEGSFLSGREEESPGGGGAVTSQREEEVEVGVLLLLAFWHKWPSATSLLANSHL